MQLPEIVSEYLEKAVPTAISEKRHKKLSDELECHILDKAEHYMEIGYSEKESYRKAVEEMGDGEKVREQFNEIYGEKKSHVIIFAIVFTLIHMLIYRYGENYIGRYSIDGIMFSTLYTVGLSVLIALLYKARRKYTLFAVSIPLLMYILLYFDGPFRLVSYATIDNIVEFAGGYDNIMWDSPLYMAIELIQSGLSYAMLIASYLGSIYLFKKVDNNTDENRSRRRIRIRFNEKHFYRAIASFAAAMLCAGTVNMCIGVHDGYLDFSSEIYDIQQQIENVNELKKVKKSYERMNRQTTFAMADEFLRSNNFIPYEKPNISKETEYFNSMLTYKLDSDLFDTEDTINYINKKLPNAVVYLNDKSASEYVSLVNYIIIPKNGEHGLSFKHMGFYEPEPLLSESQSQDSFRCKDILDSLKNGDSRTELLELFDSTLAGMDSVTEIYSDNSTIYQYSYYSYNEENAYSINFNLVFEKDKLIDKFCITSDSYEYEEFDYYENLIDMIAKYV